MKLFKRRKVNVLVIATGKNDSEAIRSLQKHIKRLRIFGYKIVGDLRTVMDAENRRCIAFQQMRKSKA